MSSPRAPSHEQRQRSSSASGRGADALALRIRQFVPRTIHTRLAELGAIREPEIRRLNGAVGFFNGRNRVNGESTRL